MCSIVLNVLIKQEGLKFCQGEWEDCEDTVGLHCLLTTVDFGMCSFNSVMLDMASRSFILEGW